MNELTSLPVAGLIIPVVAAMVWIYTQRKDGLPLLGLLLQRIPAGPASLIPSSQKPTDYRFASSANPSADSPMIPGGTPTIDPERRQSAGALVFLGFLLGFLSLSLRQDLSPETSRAYLPFLACGLLLFLAGVYLASRLERKTFLDPMIEWIASKMGIRPAQSICLVSGILLAVLATVAAGTSPLMISPWIAITSWITGIGLTVLGSWHFTPSAEKSRLPIRAFAWAAGLSLIAFLLRAVLVGQIPVALAGDEGLMGLDALQFRNGNVNNPFGIFSALAFPSLYYFLESLGIAAFGRTIEALRYPSALAGAMTVGALYLVVRSMYSHRHALAAAVFLSALHLHMHFSRLGLNNVWDGLWYLVALGALWYGWQSGRRAYWILAGLALGIGQYFYATTRFLLIIIPLWLAVTAVIDRESWRRNFRNLLPFLAAFTAVILPLGWYIGTHFHQYVGVLQTNTIFGSWMENAVREQGLPAWRIILNQLGLGFGGFFSVNLSFWYRPGTPILRSLPAVFFIFGLAILSLRLRDTRTWIALLWLAAYGVTVSLSESAPAAQRLPGVGPACALVVGFGVVELAGILSNLFPSRKRLLGFAAILLVGYMAFDDVRFYFFEYTPQSAYGGQSDFVGTGGEVAKDLVEQLKSLPGEWQVIFFPNELMGYYSNAALQFLASNAKGTNLDFPWGSPDNPPIPQGNLLFVFMPGREGEIPQVLADYPGGETGETHAADGSLLYSYYEVQINP